jgi:hypothetical protein
MSAVEYVLSSAGRLVEMPAVPGGIRGMNQGSYKVLDANIVRSK